MENYQALQLQKGSFWWRDILKILDKYKGLSSVIVNNGKSCLLWDDLWNGKVRKLQYPELHSFAKNKSIILCRAYTTSELHELFSLTLSVEAFQQMQELQLEFFSLHLSEQHDKWEYIWGSSHFSSAKTYKCLAGHTQADPILKMTWKTSCQGKHKIFFWLALRDRLSTRDIRRRGMHLDDYKCVLCQQAPEETVMHLLFYCPFAKNCWGLINFQFPDGLSIPEIFQAWKSKLLVGFSLDIFIIWCWAIWMVRNDTIFRNKAPTIQACKRYIYEEASLLLHRAKASVSPQLDSWISSNL